MTIRAREDAAQQRAVPQCCRGNMPLLLRREQAATYCGLSPKVFDELVRPLTRPVKARSASRWAISDLERVVASLQEQAQEEAVASQLATATIRAPMKRTTPRKPNAPSGSRSKPNVTRVVYVMPGDPEP